MRTVHLQPRSVAHGFGGAAFEGVRDITPMVMGIVPFGLAIGAAIGDAIGTRSGTGSRPRRRYTSTKAPPSSSSRASRSAASRSSCARRSARRWRRCSTLSVCNAIDISPNSTWRRKR